MWTLRGFDHVNHCWSQATQVKRPTLCVAPPQRNRVGQLGPNESGWFRWHNADARHLGPRQRYISNRFAQPLRCGGAGIWQHLYRPRQAHLVQPTSRCGGERETPMLYPSRSLFMVETTQPSTSRVVSQCFVPQRANPLECPCKFSKTGMTHPTGTTSVQQHELPPGPSRVRAHLCTLQMGRPMPPSMHS